MDAKISINFWSDPKIEELDRDQKLAALWAITGGRTTLFGYLEVTRKRYEFETGSPYEALASLPEAHAKGFRKCGEGIWIRRFIAHQFGTGNSLVRNNFCKAILNELRAYEGLPVFTEVLLEYPELQEPYDELFYNNPELPLGRACQGLTKPKRREEKSRTEQSSSEGASDFELRPDSTTDPKDGKNPGFEKKEGGQDPLLVRARRLFWNDSRRAMPETFTLDASESAAWKKNRAAVAATSGDEWRLLEWAYAQTGGDAFTYRRKRLAQLLNNWNGELTSARDWARRAGALTSIAKAAAVTTNEAPEGWQAAAQELFPGCDVSRGWPSLTPEVQTAVLEFLKKKKGAAE